MIGLFNQVTRYVMTSRNISFFLRLSEKDKDGTILMKETVDIASKKSLSGNWYFMSDFVGLFAMLGGSGNPQVPGLEFREHQSKEKYS